MIANALRTSRRGALRLAQQQSAVSRRTFSAGVVRQADLVQDLYLRELKNYKIPQVKASDAEGQVHKFVAPKAGKSPEEANLASELQQYDSQAVEVEGQSADGEAGASHEVNWFENNEEFADPKEDAHH